MTLEEMSAAALARDPAGRAIEFDHVWYDWGDMRRVADRVLALLDDAGIPAGSPVAFLPRPRPSAAAALLGVIGASRTVRMVYVFQSSAGIIRDVRALRPPVLIAGAGDFSPELVDMLREEGIAGIALEEMEARFVPGLETSTIEADREAPSRAIETLTSGTTGPPKRFPLSFDLIADRFVKSRPGTDAIAAGSSAAPMLLPAPLGNFSGIYGLLPGLIAGQPIVMQDRFTLDGWRDFIRRYPPRHAYLPTVGLQMVLDAGIPREELAGIEAIITGAAPLDPEVQRAFEEHYGLPVLYSYGATEFAGSAAAMTPELHAEWGKRKYGSVGRPVPGIGMRIVDPETGAEQPRGAEGVVEVLAPHMGPDWIRTSDLALIDEDGFVFHRGRADGAIVRGGFKLLPEVIERALLLHPDIAAVSVIGMPDRRLGQVPAALIQLRAGAARPPISSIESHLRDHVMSTHIPTRWCFVDALPLTPSLKVDRAAARGVLEAEAVSP